MKNQSTAAQICKTIICLALIIVWAYIFITLIIIGPPIWAILLLIVTTICISKFFKSTKYKKLDAKIDELDSEVQKLRAELADQTVRRAMDKAESREKKD